MNQKIKILPPEQAIKIAAGEVVERPAHIIKELIENSLDAKAKCITVYLEHAGRTLIKIVDDGHGMSPNDAKLCFAHHATSKIHSIDDLQTITSYGFRGEALSSIASVSHVTLVTKTEDDQTATQITVAHGTMVEQTITSHPTGTTFIITQLFEQIPARKKFLKNDETELNAIMNIFQAFALRFPSVTFKIFNDNKLLYNCQKTENLKLRIAQLFSTQLHDQIILLEPKTEHGVTICGAISSVHYHRFNRGQIFIFVNNRWIKNHDLIKAVFKGYDGVLPSQKFPAAFLFIEIDLHDVDINIHPKKEEVKFLHPARVNNTLQASIKQGLNSQVKQALNTQTPSSNTATITPDNYFSPARTTSMHSQISNVHFLHKIPTITHQFTTTPFAPTSMHKDQIPDYNEKLVFNHDTFTIIGQFHKTYILIEKDQQLILIDQHAAHERILYERFKQQTHATETINLLFPHIIKCSQEQIARCMLYQPLLQAHGIIIDQFSETEIMIQSTPIATSGKQTEEILRIIIDDLEKHNTIDHDQLQNILHEKIIIERACKSAIKAGDVLNEEQMKNVLTELQKTEQNFCCPHGRPTMWATDLKDIEKQFKRDYASAKKIEL